MRKYCFSENYLSIDEMEKIVISNRVVCENFV